MQAIKDQRIIFWKLEGERNFGLIPSELWTSIFLINIFVMKSCLWVRVAKDRIGAAVAEQQRRRNNIDFYRELLAILNCFFFAAKLIQFNTSRNVDIWRRRVNE